MEMASADPARIAAAINTLGAFCGPRDLAALTPEALRLRYHLPRLDVAVLFGGSILAGGDAMAEAMRAGLAQSYIIVGGAGHTTNALRGDVRDAFLRLRRYFPIREAIDGTAHP